MGRITFMNDSFSHLNESGEASMVDVSNRDITKRTAIASALVTASPETIAAVKEMQIKKGDVIGTARIAGILAAKKTSELIPLCHPIAIHNISLDFYFTRDSISITSEVVTVDRTGVEMEALTAVSVAALTVFDMIKSVDSYAVISDIQMVSKSGGKNGDWQR